MWSLELDKVVNNQRWSVIMILGIKWKDHKVLGNLSLDFRKSDGTPYNTIVIAGENGTGKTSILNSIYSIIKGKPLLNIEKIWYYSNGVEFEAEPDASYNIATGFYKRTNRLTGQSTSFTISENSHNERLENDPDEMRRNGCVYSSARSGFKTSEVKSSSTSQLDSNKIGEDEDFDYTQIKQLLVDVHVQDTQDWYELSNDCASDSNPINFIAFKKQSRMSRFSKAFDNFFDSSLKFKDIDNNNPKEKTIRFIKDNKLIGIDELSTGEKQIVYRGAYCLRNSRAVENGVVLVDEPELSMHPKWQQKIMEYYRGLFKSESGQSVQMIFATHSQYLISSAFDDRENVKIIILHNQNGQIVANDVDEVVLPRNQASEVNYLAFGICSEDYFLSLYNMVQEISKSHGYNNDLVGCDQFIKNQEDFDSGLERNDRYKRSEYYTLPTYIRNTISHPDSDRHFSSDDLELSIRYLRQICLKYNQ